MKKILSLILLSPFLSMAQPYHALHQKAIFVDSHNDILTACIEKNLSMDQDLKGKTHSDLHRFKEAGVDVQLFSIWCDGNQTHPFAWANREMDSLDAIIQRNPGKIIITKNSAAIKQAIKQHQLAAMFGVEGGHMIEGDLNKLDALYQRGMRYMTLTWNNSNPWATSAMDESQKADSLAKTHKGLTDFGKQVIRRMNELGVMVDLSHVGEQTFWDAIATSTKPVLVSHSNAYSLCPIFRNLKDDQIKAVAKNGGVISLNFYSGFIDSTFKKKEAAFLQRHASEMEALIKAGTVKEYALSVLTEKYASEVQAARPPLSALMDHMDYLVKLAGVDHVGIGSDFDGITSTPVGLEEVIHYELITKAMLERGYSKKDIRKILGGNLLRLLQANEVVSH